MMTIHNNNDNDSDNGDKQNEINLLEIEMEKSKKEILEAEKEISIIQNTLRSLASSSSSSSSKKLAATSGDEDGDDCDTKPKQNSRDVNSLKIGILKVSGLPPEAKPITKIQLSSPIESKTLTSLYDPLADDDDDDDEDETKSDSTIAIFKGVDIHVATIELSVMDDDIPLGISALYDVNSLTNGSSSIVSTTTSSSGGGSTSGLVKKITELDVAIVPCDDDGITSSPKNKFGDESRHSDYQDAKEELSPDEEDDDDDNDDDYESYEDGVDDDDDDESYDDENEVENVIDDTIAPESDIKEDDLVNDDSLDQFQEVKVPEVEEDKLNKETGEVVETDNVEESTTIADDQLDGITEVEDEKESSKSTKVFNEENDSTTIKEEETTSGSLDTDDVKTLNEDKKVVNGADGVSSVDNTEKDINEEEDAESDGVVVENPESGKSETLDEDGEKASDASTISAADNNDNLESNEMEQADETGNAIPDKEDNVQSDDGKVETSSNIETEGQTTVPPNSTSSGVVLLPTCTLKLRVEYTPSLKDQRDDLYDQLNLVSKRKQQAIIDLRKNAALLGRLKLMDPSSKKDVDEEGSGNKSVIKAGFLNKKVKKEKEPFFMVRWYNRVLGPESFARSAFPILKNYILFFGGIALMHFQGQQLALPPPV